MIGDVVTLPLTAAARDGVREFQEPNGYDRPEQRNNDDRAIKKRPEEEAREH
jgi:hypothetical protein